MLQTLRKRIVAIPRISKRVILVSFDATVLALSVWASYALRFDRWTLPSSWPELLAILAAPAVALPIFFGLGLYRAVVRYLPERAIWKMLQAITIAVLVWLLLAYLTQLTGQGTVPRSVALIYWALAATSIIGSRFLAKFLFWPSTQRAHRKSHPVLIYGAGTAGTQLASSLRSSHFIVGFIDDNKELQRRDVLGIRVYGPHQIPTLIKEFDVKDIILSIPSLSPLRRKEILASVSACGAKVQSLPGITDLVSGKYLVSQIRDIGIDELLGRSSVPPKAELVQEMIVGRSILVSGAGGSIGSELCRKIALWKPRCLVLLEANEFALYKIDQELSGQSSLTVIPVLASVTDEAATKRAIHENGVQVVFHAAAHKHVPLVEANALEGIRNNILGTKTIADVSFETGVDDFVLISTDKAVRPTNVMGATKRWAELIVREKAVLAHQQGTGQRFSAVRFGNVLGSNGSVVPLFKKQIENGGPITLTDPAMTRYFMSIAEAAELIVQAGALSKGGDVFLLDMGEPILIADLAENMIRLAGYSLRSDADPDGDIEIVVTGKRPGEKLFEELFYDQGSASRTDHPKILRGPTPSGSFDEFEKALAELELSLAAQDEARARSLLFEVVSKSDKIEMTGRD